MDFALDLQGDTFGLTFLTSGEAVDAKWAPFEVQLEPFLVGTRPFERGERGSERRWSFNSGTRDLILEELEGDLLLYDCPHKPEGLTIYAGERTVLETVSHEGVLLMELTGDEYSAFRKLQVDHSLQPDQ